MMDVHEHHQDLSRVGYTRPQDADLEALMPAPSTAHRTGARGTRVAEW